MINSHCVEVTIDLADIDDDYMISFLEDNGYVVHKQQKEKTLLDFFTQEELDWLENYIIDNDLDNCNMVVRSILNKVRFK